MRSSSEFIFDRPQDESTKKSFLTDAIDIMDRNKNYSKYGFFLNICKKPVMTVNIVILMKKHLWLRSAINDVIGEMQSTGLIQYAIEEVIETKYYKIVEKDIGKQRLSLDQFQATFIILLFGVVTSIFVFISELIFYNN